MQTAERIDVARPGAVYALVALNIIGLVASALDVLGGDRWGIPLLAFGAWIAYGLWSGWTWAFSVSFMLAALAAGLFILGGTMQFLLGGGAPQPWIVAPFAGAVAMMILLMRPETKRFSGHPSVAPERDLA